MTKDQVQQAFNENGVDCPRCECTDHEVMKFGPQPVALLTCGNCEHVFTARIPGVRPTTIPAHF